MSKEAPLYRFTGRYIDKDPEGYYFPRWDKAVAISVVAPTKAEAFTKLWALLGPSPRHRVWTAIWDRIDEEIPPPLTSSL